MQEENTNPLVRFYPVPGHDHFSVIAPLAELLAGQVAAGEVEVREGMVVGLE